MSSMGSDEAILRLIRCHQQQFCPKMYNLIQLIWYLPRAHFLGNVLKTGFFKKTEIDKIKNVTTFCISLNIF